MKARRLARCRDSLSAAVRQSRGLFPGPENVSEARPGLGRRSQRLSARSITHALSTIERLGWESGLYDTIIRTDSQPITKSPILFKQGTGIATGEQFLARNLDYFDAIFFFGVREIDLDAAAARRPAVVRARRWQGIRGDACGRDGVLLVAGVRRDARRPVRRTPVGDQRSHGGGRRSPHHRSLRHLPPAFAVNDEHYQLKDFSRKNVHVLARLDPAKLDLKAPLVHRTDGDFPVA